MVIMRNERPRAGLGVWRCRGPARWTSIRALSDGVAAGDQFTVRTTTFWRN
jgi:hypothetical protein